MQRAFRSHRRYTIRFKVRAKAHWIGLGNGDPIARSPTRETREACSAVWAQAILQASKIQALTIEATSDELQEAPSPSHQAVETGPAVS